ncbi:hypothetical protein E1I69_14005 [Bacillus timonensis]|uniref:Nucleic acid-binding protein n=1 Tax=Bacillus timonensis TaxID=1033734 RepID=A0A4S3PR51_9BACI|nr:hypothetical protein E1I69_14005 [Bacillus timonensis]
MKLISYKSVNNSVTTKIGGDFVEGKGCVKCGSTNAGTKDVSMTGSGLTKMLDIQNNRFTVVYCKNCGYSEFYNKNSSTASNILDLFFG